MQRKNVCFKIIVFAPWQLQYPTVRKTPNRVILLFAQYPLNAPPHVPQLTPNWKHPFSTQDINFVNDSFTLCNYITLETLDSGA